MPQKRKAYMVEITETAWEMLLVHARFLANVSALAADALIDAFIAQANTLCSMPERYPWLEHDQFPFQRYRKLLLNKHYMALYEIRESIVYIVAVMDCRQSYEWLTE